MLDLTHDAKDTIGEYVFSGSSGKYQAPPYEKLLVNTLDMLNYLELKDLNGARVEARRLAVMQKYVVDELHERDNPVLGLGGFLAGFTFEASDQPDEALRWYDEALQFAGFRALESPVRLLLQRSPYRSPRLRQLEAAGPPPPAPPIRSDGEILFVVGYGRVPHKIAQRVPIGLALTEFSGALAPNDAARANALAAQGLVTWINFPTLGPEPRFEGERPGYTIPLCTLDSRVVPLEMAVNVSEQVRAEWKKIEGKIIVSAITRMIARYAAGSAVGAAAGNNGLVGALLLHRYAGHPHGAGHARHPKLGDIAGAGSHCAGARPRRQTYGPHRCAGCRAGRRSRRAGRRVVRRVPHGPSLKPGRQSVTLEGFFGGGR